MLQGVSASKGQRLVQSTHKQMGNVSIDNVNNLLMIYSDKFVSFRPKKVPKKALTNNRRKGAISGTGNH